MLAAYYRPIRLVTSVVLVASAFLIVYFAREKTPMKTVQELRFSGTLEVREVRRPNCGVVLSMDRVQMQKGMR